jgi:hypothetical protein
MRRAIASAVIASIALAGCGGDGGKSADAEAPLAGYLAAGGAQGVRYETATQSGFTDASGRFRYLRGETVRFSVGGIELGSAPGANRITLFTLAGATQPTTEAALRRELERATRISTPFLRAANLARFLLAFDADGVPENGLDLTAAGAGLANASLDFGLGLYVFANRLESLPQPKTQGIPYWRPVEHLYRAQNVAVAVRVPLLTQLRGGSLLFPGADVSYTYHEGGLRESMSQDLTLDGVPEYETRMTYDSMGRPVTVRQQQGDLLGGGIDFISDWTYEYGARGQFLGQDRQTDVGGDGTVDSIAWVEIEGGAAEGYQRQIFRSDSDADGDVDVIEIFDGSIDRELHVETYISRVDEDADGTIDYRYEQVASYDASERIALLTEESDDNDDGVVEYRRVAVYTYADAPRTARSEESVDFDGDGAIDQMTIITRGLDEAGNDLTRVAEFDYNADGIVDSRRSLTATYDDERRRLTSVDDQDLTADGIADTA